MSMLDGNVLSQSHLCPVQPGSNHSQRTRQGFVQMDVPVQQLQLPSIKKTLYQNNIPPQWRLRWSKHFHMSISNQTSKEFYASLDDLCMSSGANCPMSNECSCLLPSCLSAPIPLNSVSSVMRGTLSIVSLTMTPSLWQYNFWAQKIIKRNNGKRKMYHPSSGSL